MAQHYLSDDSWRIALRLLRPSSPLSLIVPASGNGLLAESIDRTNLTTYADNTKGVELKNNSFDCQIIFKIIDEHQFVERSITQR